MADQKFVDVIATAVMSGHELTTYYREQGLAVSIVAYKPSKDSRYKLDTARKVDILWLMIRGGIQCLVSGNH